MKSLADAGVLEEMRTRLLGMTAADRPLWGSMSATQMVGHLGCACEVALGERTVGPVKMQLPPRAMRLLALWSGATWTKNVRSTPELEREIAATPEGGFDVLLRGAVARLETLTEGQNFAPSHPFFGPMRAKDWLRWGYLHTDHHLRQFGR